MITTTTPGGQRVTICTCTRTGRHLATFTRRPGSTLYTLVTEPPQVAASAQVSASGQVTASRSCRLLSHQTLLWHHRLGHPSLPRLRGMHSFLIVSGLPRSLPPLPPLPAPPCLPCVEGRQRAAPRSYFRPTAAPLQTLHMDVKGEVVDVLIPWIRTVRIQLRERFCQDLPVLRLHSDKGGEFSSNLLRDLCRGEGILQSFTLPDSPEQNGIAERRIGLVMEVARTSMIHAAAPHFLWPFAVRYAAHQLNLWPSVSLPEILPTLRWTGEVGDASVFRVWGSRAFVRDTSADKLSPRPIPCDVTFDKLVPFCRLFPYRSAPPPPPPLFLAPGAPPVDPLPPQDLAPSGVSQVDPLPGPAPVQVAVGLGGARDGVSGCAASGGAEPKGAESEGAETWGAELGGFETGGAESEGAEPEGVEPGGAASEGAESGGAEPHGAALSGGSAGASPRLSPQQQHEWFVRRARLRSGATGAGGAGAAGAGGAGVAAGDPGGTTVTGSGGARTRGTGAARTGGVEGSGAGDPTESRATGAGGSGAGGAGAGGVGVGGTCVGVAGAGGDGAVDPGGAVRPRPYFVPLLQQVLGTPSSTGLTPPLLCPPPDQSQSPLQPASPLPALSPYTEQSGGHTERREPVSHPVSPVCTAHRVPRSRPPLVPGTHAMTLRLSSIPLLPLSLISSPLLSQTLRLSPLLHLLSLLSCLTLLLPASLDYATALVAESVSATPLSVEGECALDTDVLEDRQEDFECLVTTVSRFASMLLAPEGVPDAPDIPTPRSYAEAFAGPYSSHWQAAMDAEMASWKSTGTYVDEVPPPEANIVDGMWIFRVKHPPGSLPAFKARYVARGFSQRQGVDYFQTFSAKPKMTTLRVLLHVATQRDYELHSFDFSTTFLHGSLHEEIWLRRPPGFTESFPAGTQWSLRRPVYGLRQSPREWHNTLRTTLAALGFALATADPSLFPRTDLSLPPFYVLVYIDDLVFATADTESLTLVKSELQKIHTCTDLGELRSYLGLQITRFPITESQSSPFLLQQLHLFLHLAAVAVQPRTFVAAQSSSFSFGFSAYLGLQITRDRARRTIILTQSHMVHQVLQRFGFQFSSPQPTPLSTSHSLSAPPSDESVEPSGPYLELVGCLITSGMGLVLGGRGLVVLSGHADASWVDDLATQRSSQGYTFSLGSGSISWWSTCSSSVLSSICEAEIYAGAMAAQELRWLTYLLTDLGEQPRSPPILYVDNKAMIALCQEHRLEHRTKHIALRYFLARELQQRGQLHLAYVATRANTADIFTKALPPGDHQRFSIVLGLVPTLPHLLTA
ncbi:unnamed protein product [Closterium sp. NIES-54]